MEDGLPHPGSETFGHGEEIATSGSVVVRIDDRLTLLVDNGLSIVIDQRQRQRHTSRQRLFLCLLIAGTGERCRIPDGYDLHVFRIDIITVSRDNIDDNLLTFLLLDRDRSACEVADHNDHLLGAGCHADHQHQHHTE